MRQQTQTGDPPAADELSAEEIAILRGLQPADWVRPMTWLLIAGAGGLALLGNNTAAALGLVLLAALVVVGTVYQRNRRLQREYPQLAAKIKSIRYRRV